MNLKNKFKILLITLIIQAFAVFVFVQKDISVNASSCLHDPNYCDPWGLCCVDIWGIGAPVCDVCSGGGGGGGVCTGCYPALRGMYPVDSTTVTKTSDTSAIISWTYGVGTACGKRGHTDLFIGTNKAAVDNNCGIAGGQYDPESVALQAGCGWHRYLSNVTTSYNTADPLTRPFTLDPNTIYYVKVITHFFYTEKRSGEDFGNMCSGSRVPYLANCPVSPSSATIDVGSSATFTTNASSPEITNVGYSGNVTYFSVNPASDASSPYSTLVTAITASYPLSITLTSSVYAGGIASPPACISTSAVTTKKVTSFDPWWQVKDSDVASNSDLSSKVPAGDFFGLPGGGGYPGVPAYGGTGSFSPGGVSLVGWQANSGITNPKIYDYQYFINQIPDDTSVYPLSASTLDQAAIDANTTSSYGYFWYKFDGSVTGLDLSTSGPIDLGSKKVILLVNSADFYINDNINLTDGQGFFMVAVGKTAGGTKGDINVATSVGGAAGPNLEGLYVADGAFRDNSVLAGDDIALKVRGSVVGYDGVALQRDLGAAGNSSPGELLEYAPDQILLFPSRLGFRKINWKEVAP